MCLIFTMMKDVHLLLVQKYMHLPICDGMNRIY
jgi:hypothetical protein